MIVSATMRHRKMPQGLLDMISIIVLIGDKLMKLPFTIFPNVGDYVSYINEQGETQFLIVSKRLFNQVTNNLVITLKNI